MQNVPKISRSLKFEPNNFKSVFRHCIYLNDKSRILSHFRDINKKKWNANLWFDLRLHFILTITYIFGLNNTNYANQVTVQSIIWCKCKCCFVSFSCFLFVLLRNTRSSVLLCRRVVPQFWLKGRKNSQEQRDMNTNLLMCNNNNTFIIFRFWIHLHKCNFLRSMTSVI